jgi:hypothetical protein
MRMLSFSRRDDKTWSISSKINGVIHLRWYLGISNSRFMGIRTVGKLPVNRMKVMGNEVKSRVFVTCIISETQYRR